MVCYKCDICGKLFDRKDSLNKHLARKKKCIAQSGSKTNKIYYPKCNQCHKSFSRKDSLDRHRKVCKGNINKKNNTIIKGSGSINNVKNINKSNIKGNVEINNISINKPVIIKPIYVELNFFGKDGIESLTLDEFIKIVKSDENPYEAIIKAINFDPTKPQHHNVYYPDLKATYGKIYENKKWVDKKINEIINKMLDIKTEDLHAIINKLDGIINKKTKQNIIKTIKDIDNSNPECRKKLISYIKPILHNNKDMVLKTKKLLEELDDFDDYADE